MPKGNATYDKYLALSKTAKGRAILDTIAKGEGTERADRNDSYYVGYGGKPFNIANGHPRVKTDLGNGKTTDAAGRYQFLGSTWNNMVRDLGLDPNDFSQDAQDAAAAYYASTSTKAFQKLEEGDYQGMTFELGKKWQAFPINEKGDAIGGKKALYSPEQTKAIYTKKLNEANTAGGTKNEVSKKVVYDKYMKEVGDIQKQKIPDFTKELLIKDINKKYYDGGHAGLINQGLQKEQEKNNKIEALYGKLEDYKNGKLTIDQIEDFKKEIINSGLELPLMNIKTKPGEYLDKNGKLFDNYGKAAIDQEKLLQSINNIKYGVTKGLKPFDTTEFEKVNYVEQVTEPAEEIVKTDEEIKAEEAAKKAAADAEALAKGKAEYEGKVANWDANSIADTFAKDGMFTDPSFKYKPGKAEIPFDALASLGTALVGMAAGNVEINYRDEQISEGMLNYASDLERIKNMGLPPEKEAELNNHLAEMYTTGMNNMVRASAGNRNLVLGNQGQLDSARMQGVIEIANMDLERRDKAMMAYGEVMKYFNEFDTTKAVANNEREYNQIEKQQLAGATVAQNGMEGVLNALQYNRENGPGSANDMYRQLMMFNISGIDQNAKPGEVGSVEYRNAIAAKNTAHLEESEKAEKWRAGLTKEQSYHLNQTMDKEMGFNFNLNRKLTADEYIAKATESLGLPTQEEILYQTTNGTYKVPASPIVEKDSNGQTVVYDPFRINNSNPDTTEDIYKDKQINDAILNQDTDDMNIFNEATTGGYSQRKGYLN